MSTRPPLDEMVDGRGGLRPHWRRVLDTLTSLGRDLIVERADRMNRAFAEEGVTSLLAPATQSWRCDPVPLPLAAAEFALLEAGLAQRAQLLEALLADVYGAQNLLAEGLLPPELVFANPGFKRASCIGMPAPRLHCYAADLIRGPDGAWRVLADRTSAANGVAYALENRRMLARVMPEFFRPGEIAPMRPFFDAWQDSLQRLAPAGGGNPGVALLTPGHGDMMWFEHVLLSRELSCALVEAGDLTVRDGRLFLKTLRGLQPVDVLLSKRDSRGIDPLESDSGSTGNGVPGLLDAVRGHAVRVVNDPGAIFAEAPAISAFLPGLAQRLLGAPLLLNAVPTLWLGEERARTVVLGDITRWNIRPALDGNAAAASGAALNLAARAALAERIARTPRRYVATADIPPSVAPSGSAEGMIPRRVVLRLFLIFDGTRWQCLQGGLARALEGDAPLVSRLSTATLSKDVWVLVEDPQRVMGGPSVAMPALPIRRTSGELPSRVADNFFWLGRYLERLEHGARLQRSALVRLSRAALTVRDHAELELLVDCLVQAEILERDMRVGASLAPLGDALLRGGARGGWMAGKLNQISLMTELLRDRLSGDMYALVSSTLRTLDVELRALRPEQPGPSMEKLSAMLARIIGFAATVAGLSAENMVRGGGRLFLDLGRRLERAYGIAADLAEVLDNPTGTAQPGRIEDALRLALELCDSGITYRSRYLTVLQPAPALDLVVEDEGNPRSLCYQLATARALLAEIADDYEAPLADAAEALLHESRALVRDVTQARDQNEVTSRLPERLRAVAHGIAELSDRITQQYFALLPLVHSLGLEDETTPLRGAA